MTLTQDQRIAIIKHAIQDSKGLGLKTSLEDFVSEIKSQQVLGEHGLLDAQNSDIEDESSLLNHSPNAEDIEEEDNFADLGISDQMKGVYNG
jgi:hypothetical protein